MEKEQTTTDDADDTDRRRTVGVRRGERRTTSVKSVNRADGISEIEGKAATGSGERVGKGASFKSVVEITGVRRGGRSTRFVLIGPAAAGFVVKSYFRKRFMLSRSMMA